MVYMALADFTALRKMLINVYERRHKVETMDAIGLLMDDLVDDGIELLDNKIDRLRDLDEEDIVNAKTDPGE